MKGKLRRKLMWVQISVLAAVLSGGALIYYLAAPFYQSLQKNQLIWEAYRAVKEMDLDMLEYSDESIFWQYEEQNLRFTIADENFYPVYSTWMENMHHQVERHIMKHQEEFSENPVIVNGENELFPSIKLMGKIEDGGETYYVCIRTKKDSLFSISRNTEFVLAVFLFSACISLPVLYIFVKRNVQSLEEILEGTDKIARQDYDVHLHEDWPSNELNRLAGNINRMAAQLQSSREKQEQENRQYRKALQNRAILENFRKDVVADISHELKTPLAIISSQVEMLQCMDDRIDRSYYYGSIVEEVSRMSDMVGELTDLSLFEQKLQEMEQCDINLTEIMEYIQLKYQALFRQNHIKSEFSVEAGCYVRGNAHYLEQAIDNYIMNAFSHTAQGNSIRVCLYQERNWAWVTVYNQGGNIDPSDAEDIWQGYVLQRPKENSREGKLEQKHMGVGLYLVRRIIRLHRGECGMENMEKGVKFWFKIPVGKEEREEGE